ncbi:UNVERIFIED_CONTAM: hypothetical protein Sangu_0743400 [Sesamum angustifolium]|uniref:C2 domain-containing protein n=1 Tax=Sesamum angustifolium TaxID=2727405 RepID=A0AAW2PS19_9LAMI
MASRYELEVTIISAEDLKNVNWRHGKLKPYAVVWLDPSNKSSTRADEEGDASPYWNDNLLIPFNSLIDDSTLYVEVVHANVAEGTKQLIGSAKLALRDIAEDVGLGNVAERKLELKRPSGRPQGKLQIKVTVREPRGYVTPPAIPYGRPYGAPPARGTPPSVYPDYAAPRSYGKLASEQGSNYGGIGWTGAGGGFGALEHKIGDDAADRVEDDLGYDGDDY